MFCLPNEMSAEIAHRLRHRWYRIFGNLPPIRLSQTEPPIETNVVDVEAARAISKPVEVPELPRRVTRIDNRLDVEALNGRVKMEFFFGWFWRLARENKHQFVADGPHEFPIVANVGGVPL
jgi:hypothetical protein